MKRLCLVGLQCSSFTLTFVLVFRRLFLDNEAHDITTLDLSSIPRKNDVVTKMKALHITDWNDAPFRIIYEDRRGMNVNKHTDVKENDDDEFDNAPYMDNMVNSVNKENDIAGNVMNREVKQTFADDVFIFSAIVGNSSSTRAWDEIVVQVWEHKRYDNMTFGCCIKYISGECVYVNASRKVEWANKRRCTMPVKQYYCPNPRFNYDDLPVAVSVSNGTARNRCNCAMDVFVETEFAYANGGSIAVCTKLVYGNIPADDVLTWLEMHYRLGASKVLIHTFDLNADAVKVLQYYQSLGLAEFSTFNIPNSRHWFKQRGGRVVRAVGEKNYQAWNDEQILIYNCLEKLKGYKYLLVLDIDEYLVPNHQETLPQLFDTLWIDQPNAAGFSFLVTLHITSWGATDNSSQFTVGRYLNRTSAMPDRTKHVTRPERIVPGGLSTHQFYPRWDQNYHRFRAEKDKAVIHHYRECRTDWKKRRNITCLTLERFRDASVAQMLASIELDLLKIKSVLFSGG